MNNIIKLKIILSTHFILVLLKLQMRLNLLYVFRDPKVRSVIMGDELDKSIVNNNSQVSDRENLFVLVTMSSLHNNSSSISTNTVSAIAQLENEGLIKYQEDDGGLLVEIKNIIIMYS